MRPRADGLNASPAPYLAARGRGDLLIRNVEVDGRAGLDVRLAGGRIAQIGPGLSGAERDLDAPDLDAKGGALLPGLIDHHIHLFGLAAAAASVQLAGASSQGAIAA
ncbi:MAG TPA: hypothetical protein VF459_16005, partial [Caulobacteraceae bacterium]